jgi:hypothetical protein
MADPLTFRILRNGSAEEMAKLLPEDAPEDQPPRGLRELIEGISWRGIDGRDRC